MSFAIALGTGLMMGLLTSIPVGPVAGMVVQYAVRHDRRAAYLCALGCATVDGAYALAASFGVSRALDEWPSIVPAMYATGGAVLVLLGIATLRERPPSELPATRPLPSRPRALFTGVLLSGTNPVPLLAWVGLSGTVMATLNRAALPLFGIGVVGGVFAWFCAITELSHRGKDLLGKHAAKLSQLIAGLLLLSASLCFWRAWDLLGAE